MIVISYMGYVHYKTIRYKYWKIHNKFSVTLANPNYKFNDLKKSKWNQSYKPEDPGANLPATVLSTVLYGAESWTCTNNEYSRLNAFNTKLLRVLTRKQRDEMSNGRLYKVTGMEPLGDTIRKYRLSWAGHVRRIDDTRLSKKILFETVA